MYSVNPPVPNSQTLLEAAEAVFVNNCNYCGEVTSNAVAMICMDARRSTELADTYDLEFVNMTNNKSLSVYLLLFLAAEAGEI